MTGTAATPTTVTGIVTTPAPATGTAAEPGNQPMPVSVRPIHKKKSWKEGGIDKVIGKGAQALSPWRHLQSAMKERYPFKEDVLYRPGKWTTMERGIQYLRELAVLEVIYGDLDNEQLSKEPDEVWCTRPTWWKLVRSAPESYANSLAILTWKD
ncbi:hypothetical protein QYF61_001447 [Mycteria americana]|uniref:Uncharacterized protein n=1 Tax=Mycteria americana TaxID=33587 RepID=A0AAN7S1M0_MYCAM|nr:hypothetical protein QYF61_001447 [Mycteria americana]